jgi:hypothetical protein
MLSQEQLGFFARNGFLHVPQWIDAGTCAQLVDHTWTRLPPEWRRNDPSTWSGPLGDSCHIADIKARRGLLKFQGGDLLRNPVIEGAFAPNARGGELANALLGHPLGKLKVRGLYCIVPMPASISAPGPAEAHLEAHPSQLIALCYLEDVLPGGGGLHVWPGSHRELYPALGSKLEHVATPTYQAAFDRWTGLQPVEVPGRQGDIVIIHHRLLHAPSVNRSPNMRYGFLCDYMRDDFRRLCGEAPGPLWEDWPAIAALPPNLRDAPSDYTLEPQRGGVDPNPASAKDDTLFQRLRRQWRRLWSRGDDADPSSVRKADASVLARQRRPGDVWLTLSDSPKSINCLNLFPRGADLTSEGVRVRVDGHPLTSTSKYDFIAQLDPAPGQHVLEIAGLRRSAWLQVIEIKLPFVESVLLVGQQLGPGTTRLSFRIEDRRLSTIMAEPAHNPITVAARPAERERVLFVANSVIPTLQLSFLKPLAALVDAGDMALDIVTEEQMLGTFGEGAAAEVVIPWLEKRFARFRPSIFVFCRYSGPHVQAMTAWAQQRGIPVIFHIDDDLLTIPRELGGRKYDFHNHPARLATVRHLLDKSDLVYCSTERLRERLLSLDTLAPQVAGTIFASGEVITEAFERPIRTVGYMGWEGHRIDLELIVPALVAYLRRHPDVMFELFGTVPLPAALDEFGDRMRVVPPVRNYEQFLAEFAARQWDIGLCPLVHIPFNLLKATTKWVEYTSAGIAVLASRNTVYDDCCADGCGMLATTEEEWLTALEELTDPAARYEQVVNAQVKLQRDHTLSRLREQVEEVFARAHAQLSRKAGSDLAAGSASRSLSPAAGVGVDPARHLQERCFATDT